MSGMGLPRDLQDLVAEVLSQIPRLIALQDRDPDSPMRGSLHPAYWRDKSSEVADMRRQEAALAFAWVWRHPFPDNPWRGDRDVLHAALRAMGFWTRQQHRDGTFDEWYKNEHGYATTAFSSYAMALAVEALGDALEDPLRASVLGSLRRCGRWLATHDDWFKTNHQAVGVAALGAMGRLLQEDTFLDAARRNAQAIVERMHAEGWSREISGLDIGYTNLLVEYLAMHAVLTGETACLPAIAKAFRFATTFLHPDLTTGAEYGICANPYFSRVAAVALAPHDGIAAGVLRWMDRDQRRPRDTSSTLKDDLRLARYAYQPLLAALLHTGGLERRDLPPHPASAAPVPFENRGDTHWFPGAKLLSVTRDRYAAWAAPCHGGLLRMAFRDGDSFHHPLVDRGYAVDENGKTYRNARYALDSKTDFDGARLHVEAPLVRCRFVMPPYWARVGLHLATSTPGGHRWSRWLIDQWRRRKGTALNQSAAGVSAGKSPFTLLRTVRFLDDRIEVTDVLRNVTGRPWPAGIFLVFDGPAQIPGAPLPDADRRIPLASLMTAPAASRDVEIVKIITLEDGQPVVRIGS